jgi:hypothetical protein
VWFEEFELLALVLLAVTAFEVTDTGTGKCWDMLE